MKRAGLHDEASLLCWEQEPRALPAPFLCRLRRMRSCEGAVGGFVFERESSARDDSGAVRLSEKVLLCGPPPLRSPISGAEAPPRPCVEGWAVYRSSTRRWGADEGRAEAR